MITATTEIVATLTLPRTFWSDHSWRTQDDYPVGTVVKEATRTVTVTFTQLELDNLQSDADYYADCARSGEWSRSDDPSLWAIGQSAIRTMAAIHKQMT
jgi:hypothetical protein